MAGPTTADVARSVGVVIVAYEPGPVIEAVIEAIAGERPAAVVVVDNSPLGSAELARATSARPGIVLIERPDNPGFCAANNLGFAHLPATEFVLFLNPDAVVEAGFLAEAVARLQADPRAGALNPKLVRIDPVTLRRTGEIDCAGVFHTWYGRTFDRGQGLLDDGRYDGAAQEVPALCGAALFCRREALEAVMVGSEVFDESFFMYKEDIDLSYRLRHSGWTLLYEPAIVVGHVRGFHAVASDTAARRRLLRRSLRNDWKVWRRGLLPARVRVPMFGYLIAKSVAVRVIS